MVEFYLSFKSFYASYYDTSVLSSDDTDLINKNGQYEFNVYMTTVTTATMKTKNENSKSMKHEH